MAFKALKKKWLIAPLAAFLAAPLLTFAIDTTQDDAANSVKAATTSFRFVVMGDSRGSTDGINESTLRQLMTQVKNLSPQPNFVMFTGDQVQGGSNLTTELTNWKGIVDDYYPLTSYYPTLGNHEHDETVFSNAFSYLPTGQLSGYQRSAYYFDFGNSRFITVNSDRKDANGKYIVDSTQRAWLEGLIKNNGKAHTFVQFHVPAYPIGAHYGNSLDGNKVQRDALWDIFDNNTNVSAVLVGHEHNYNRRVIDGSFSANGYTFGRSVNQVTLGGAGAPLTSSVSNSQGVVVGPKANYHYMVVDVADNVATFNVYDINNNKLDSFTVNQGATTAPTTTTTSFQNGVYPTTSYAGNIDTAIMENAPTTNYGNAATITVDGDEPSASSKDAYGLLKWDVSAIPTGKTVTSASITINVSDVTASPGYTLYELKRNWSESTATWNLYSSTAWETAGAKGANDRGTTALGTATPTATGQYTINLNSAGVALVQNWINNPASNNGFILADGANSNGLDFATSEATTTTSRPKLTVTYQ